MDKKIRAVKKSNDIKMNNLIKEDIVRDKKIKKCDAVMKHKKKE